MCPYCRRDYPDQHAHLPECPVLVTQLDPRAPEKPRAGRPGYGWPATYHGPRGHAHHNGPRKKKKKEKK